MFFQIILFPSLFFKWFLSCFFFISECGGHPADIAFIVDDSRSIQPPDFYKGMYFLRSFVSLFKINSDNVCIATVTFGKRVIIGTAFGFNKNKEKKQVLDALKWIKFRPELGGSTNTAMAIAYTRQKFFVNARPNVKKVAIVLTDGRSDNPIKTAAEAHLLKNQGVKMIAIGVGKLVDDSELKAIASDPKSVFHVNSYNALKNIIRTLGSITCKGKLKLSLCLSG